MQHRTYLAALLLASIACSDDPPPRTGEDPETIRISGTVEGDGEPVSSARVLLNAAPQYRRFDDGFRQALVVSGAGGYFGFDRVHVDTAREYDISIRDDSLGSPLLTQFLKLHHHRTVTFPLSGTRPRKAWSARVLTNLVNLPPNADVLYIASSKVLALDEGDGLTLHWTGTYQENVTLRAIAYEKDATTQLPARYLACAVNTVAVTQGQIAQWVGTFQPIATTSTEFHLSPAENVDASILVDAGDGSNAHEIGHLSAGSGTVTLPKFKDVRYTLRAEQRATNGRSRLVRRFGPADTAINETFTTPPELLDAPAPNATISKDTTFRWQADGISRVRLDAGPAFRIEVYTQLKELTLAQDALGLLGLSIAPNTPVELTVTRIPRVASVDDAIGGAAFHIDDENSADAPPLPLVLQ